MRSHNKLALWFLVALAPVSLVALAWAVGGLPNEVAISRTVTVAVILTAVAAHLRIQLPKTSSYLALSDAMVPFALLYFGGELAVLLSASAAISTFIRGKRLSLYDLLTHLSISLTTTFITAIGVLTLFGEPDDVLVKLGNWSFVLIISALTVVPFVLNTLLRSAYAAIRGDNHYWKELRSGAADGLVVYLGASIMAGLGVMALRDTNVFLFFTVGSFFAIMAILFSRYRKDFGESTREKTMLSEKHIAELRHYIEELERSSFALEGSREKYRHAAYHDFLTGLPNRNQFIETIDELLQKCAHARNHRFAVIYLDMLRFKTVNDSLGHAVGDRLIKHVASRLTKLIENDEMIGRFSGDEFAILLPHVETVEQAREFAERVLDKLTQPFVLDGRQIYTGASVGIAIGSSKYTHAGDVLRDADIAMYRAKDRNRGAVVFEEKMHVQAVSLLQLETDLRQAVERNEFELYYQPILELNTAQFCGVEALVRWRHPEFGQIHPEQFIEVAEATGLIIPMTLQIFEAACSKLNEWNNRAFAMNPLFVTINLSGKHFAHADIVEHIAIMLAKTGVDPTRVKLEITETAIMDQAERAITILKQIKDLGVQLCIDDFGTGYSSLSYLQRFPIDTLKIDRSFVRSMEDGRQNGEIVRTILALAEAMKLSVVAEGIESVHQLHQLRILNCRYGQGYLFSHPLPASEIEGLLKTPNRWENLVSGSSFSIVPPTPELLEERVH